MAATLMASAAAEDLPRYRIIDLGSLDTGDGEETRAYAINNGGEVVGYSLYEYQSDLFTQRAFLWLPEAAYGLAACMDLPSPAQRIEALFELLKK